MTDWKSILRPSMRGLAVEGENDKRIIEAFLNAGTQTRLWGNWTLLLRVEAAGKFDSVLREISDPASAGSVWGIVDRDWRSEDEISKLRRDYPQLIFLPRIMIENFCVDPDELLDLLPAAQRSTVDEDLFRSEIEHHLAVWIKHGALSKVLHENGAHRFCRGESGYPRRLMDTLVTDEGEIASILDGWRQQLDPQLVLSRYKIQAAAFQQMPSIEQYRTCVDGKTFFNQIIVSQILNKIFGQADRNTWLDVLFTAPSKIPTDLEPILRQLLS